MMSNFDSRMLLLPGNLLTFKDRIFLDDWRQATAVLDRSHCCAASVVRLHFNSLPSIFQSQFITAVVKLSPQCGAVILVVHRSDSLGRPCTCTDRHCSDGM